MIRELLSRILAAVRVLLHGTKPDETVVKQFEVSALYTFWNTDPQLWSDDDVWKRYDLSENLLHTHVVQPMHTFSIDEVRRIWIARTFYLVANEILRRQRDAARHERDLMQKDFWETMQALASCDIAMPVSRDDA